MSLRWRWAATLASVALLAVLVFGVAAAALVGRGIRQEVDRSLLQRAEILELVSLGDFPLGPRGDREPRALRALVGPDFAIQAIRPDGRVVFGTDDQPGLPVEEVDLAVAAGEASATIRTVEVAGRGYRMVTVPLRSGAIQLARELAPVEALSALLARRLLLVGLAATAVAAVAGWWLAGRATRPVEELTEAAERIAATKDLSVPIPAGGPDEVGRLATSLATMTAALGESRRQQRQLVTDASHELRTPLTGLRTNLEVLSRRPDLSAGERTELVEAALAEVGELGELVAELVDLATDASLSPEAPVTRPLHEMARPVAHRYSRLLGRTVVVEGVGDDVSFRPSRFERALGNLIDNAAKWSPADKPIEVSVEGRALEVRDHGPGIPETDLEHVFDRFYRSPEARGTTGSGLGLAIVKQAVEAHGGTVFARNHPEGGAVVGFKL